jgi:choline kinase
VIVIGYLGEVIREYVGERLGRMEITYIENPEYARTNTARSLALAGECLRRGAYVIEGDVIFDPAILDLGGVGRPIWFTDTFPQGMTGSQFLTDADGQIIFHRIIRDRDIAVPQNALKSCGLLRLTPEYGASLAEWLMTARDNEYYDDVIRRHLTDAPIYAAHVGELRWWEIDDMDDLREAERRFAPVQK